MWINQPSTLQPLHSLNGVHVLAQRENEKVSRVYFLSGEVISQQVPSMVLSLGWPETPPDPIAVLQKAINDWPEWEIPDEPVNGGDMVEWFGNWRLEALAAIAAAKEKVE